MHKRPITYKDFEGKEVTEEYYFSLTQAEILEIQASVKGGLVNRLTYAIKDEDPHTVMKLLREVILKSVGEKTPDGRYFVKFKIVDGVKVSVADLFEPTPAYSALFMELLSSNDAADDFMRKIIPADLAAELPENTQDALPDELKAVIPTELN